MLLRFIFVYYGILSPGWHTLRAVSNGQRDSIILWLQYWVIFALLQALGSLTNLLFGGLVIYTLIKLILAVLLWLSSPYSTKCIYHFINKLVVDNLELDPLYIALDQNLSRFLPAAQEDSNEDHRSELQVNGELLKQELSVLMSDIGGGDSSNQELPQQGHFNSR